MVNKKNRLKIIVDLIVKNKSAINNPGLLNGKMGICIFLYHLGRKEGNRSYTDLAGVFMDHVYESVCNSVLANDFENGLAGIAWGIEYLVKSEFIKADTDKILRDLDDKIFQYITTNQNIPIGLQSGLLGYGFYLVSRLEGKDMNHAKDHDYLLKRLLITVINRMYDMIEEKEEIFREPIHFDCTWNLPLILSFLSEVKGLNIYNHKTDIMLKRLLAITRAIYPINSGNRLFLLLSMEKVSVKLKIAKFQQHCLMLKDGLNDDEILIQFQNKNILANKGLAGLHLILGIYNSTEEKHGFNDMALKIGQGISTSDFWVGMENKEKIHAGNLGLLSGLAGVGMALINAIS